MVTGQVSGFLTKIVRHHAAAVFFTFKFVETWSVCVNIILCTGGFFRFKDCLNIWLQPYRCFSIRTGFLVTIIGYERIFVRKIFEINLKWLLLFKSKSLPNFPNPKTVLSQFACMLFFAYLHGCRLRKRHHTLFLKQNTANVLHTWNGK